MIARRSSALLLALFPILSGLSTTGCSRSREARARSVLLVTVDTLRADRLGVYGGSVATPRLDALAREGAVFSSAFAQVPLTLPSHSSILTGTYPTYHGVRDNGRFRLPDRMDTLAELLKAAGYSTAAFVGAFPLDARFGLGQGFDLYDDDFGESHGRLAFAERRAEDVVAAARRWLTIARSEPTFTWVHLFDPHAPYEAPAPFGNAYPDGYDGEVAYVDHALGALFESVGEDTLVVVTADHGEGLGEHGESTHSLFVYDSTLRVPLILRGPGVAPGAVVKDVALSIDIVPTVLELVGKAGSCVHCQGRSLVPALEGRSLPTVATYAETYFPRLNLGWSELRSSRRGKWKLIAAPEPELYDLDADPGELRNIASAHPGEVRGLEAELAKLEAATAGPDASAASPDVLDSGTLAMLRSLGYASSSRPPTPTPGSPLPDPKTRLEDWESIRRGMDQLARGETDEAIETFEKLLQRSAELVLARSYLATAYFDRGRFRDAAAECTTLLTRVPGDFDATLLFGRSLLRLGKDPEARELLERAAAIDSASADPWVELAQLALHRRSNEQAESSLAEARKRDDRAPGVKMVEGKIAMLRGDLRSADAAFRGALDAAPFEEEPRTQLGNLLLTERRLAEAEGLFRDGLRYRPQSSQLHVGLGNTLALAGRMGEAIPELERALALSPDSPMVLNSLGFAYGQTGSSEKGLALLKRSLELSPDQPELRSFLRGSSK
jgi:arylsulfatase A-like enzyme/Flp pilus assembly protein TadD